MTDTEQTVLLNAVTAYMNVVRDAAVLELNRNNEKVLQRQLEATQARFDVGELTRTDVAQSEASLQGAIAARPGKRFHPARANCTRGSRRAPRMVNNRRPMSTFQCQRCGRTFTVSRATLDKYPSWQPKTCLRCRPAGVSMAGQSSRRFGSERRQTPGPGAARAEKRENTDARAAEGTLTLEEVLASYRPAAMPMGLRPGEWD